MKARGIVLITVLAVLAVLPSQALSWGNAAHVYIDDRLGTKEGFGNVNEIYGGLAPDIFGFVFEHPGLDVLPHQQAEKVWDAACGRTERAQAFGFVSHNEIWGADFTAHKSGITFGQGQGYIIAKAGQLCGLYDLSGALGIAPEAALQVCHVIVETGVDLLVGEKLDRSVGHRMATSALLRGPSFPSLLARAYAHDVASVLGTDDVTAGQFIFAAEQELRETIVLYGNALSQDTETAVVLLAEQMVALAAAFLGEPLPIPESEAVELVAGLTLASMELCKDDFDNEIRKTTQYVKHQLRMRGFTY